MYNNSAFDRASAVPRGATYLLSRTYSALYSPQPFYRCVNTMMLFGLQLARCYSHILRRMALTVPCSLWVSICVTSPRSGAFDILFINACRH